MPALLENTREQFLFGINEVWESKWLNHSFFCELAKARDHLVPGDHSYFLFIFFWSQYRKINKRGAFTILSTRSIAGSPSPSSSQIWDQIVNSFVWNQYRMEIKSRGTFALLSICRGARSPSSSRPPLWDQLIIWTFFVVSSIPRGNQNRGSIRSTVNLPRREIT